MTPESLNKQIYAACDSWWSDAPFPGSPSMGEDPPAKCKELLEDPVRPCKSVAGDTYDMGGGYFLYDTCSRDMLALDKQDNMPHPDRFDLGAPPPTSPQYQNSAG